MTVRVVVSELDTPLGGMIGGAFDGHLCLLEYADGDRPEHQLDRIAELFRAEVVHGEHPVLEQARTELREYFDGERTRFDTPVITPGTEFQEAVWDALREIPYGETRSYAQQARAIGRPDAVRAVGRANGQNRVAIIVPCHRVIGASGQLTGYGGLLWRKRALLELEGRAAPVSQLGLFSEDA